MFRKGDILAFENDGGFFGTAISEFEHLEDVNAEGLPVDPAKITHIGLVINSQQYVEASTFGIRIMPIEKLNNRRVWHCVLKADLRNRLTLPHNEHRFDRFVFSQVGVRYDFLALGQMALNILSFGLYTPKENNKYNVCSEFAIAALEAGGAVQDVNSSVETPAKLFARPIYAYRELLYV